MRLARAHAERLRTADGSARARLSYLERRLPGAAGTSTADAILRLVGAPKSRLQRWNLLFQNLVRDASLVGIEHEVVVAAKRASAELLTMCNWLSDELVSRIPRACLGPRGELCLRLVGDATIAGSPRSRVSRIGLAMQGCVQRRRSAAVPEGAWGVGGSLGAV